MANAALATVETPLSIYNKIKTFKSEGFLEQYQKNFGLNLETAESHFQELLKFLSIGASGNTEITPSEQLDEAWHALIIQTEDYQRLSNDLGIFLHHTTTERPQTKNYKNAIGLYTQFFGEPHNVWELPNLNKVKVHDSDGNCRECEIVGWCGMGS